MSTHRALVLHARDKPLVLETLPRPITSTGDAIVRILVADIVPYMGEVISNKRPYPLSLPMTPGNTAIGRIYEVSPDSVVLTPGQLVFCDITIRARDDPSVSILYGIHGGGYPAAQKLMDGVWRNATYAEYTRFPLENLYPLNEDLLLRRLGYSINDLCLMPAYLVPFGGLSEVNVKPGEVVIIAPATGRYGGAAVGVALAMGAIVIAAGRNMAALKKLKDIHCTNRLRTVQVTGDGAADMELFRGAAGRPNGADVYLDLSPPAAQESSLLASGIRSLRRFMYDRQHVLQIIQMIESGLLPLGHKSGITLTEEFGLQEIEGALEAAGKLSGWGGHVVLKPSAE
ncbi:unnamed protein product [Penicillium pancosmium]